MKDIQRKINLTHVIIISLITILFVFYIVTNFLVCEFDINDKFISIVVSLMYPILDLILIAPSAIILIASEMIINNHLFGSFLLYLCL
jgi:hypothetical protein